MNILKTLSTNSATNEIKGHHVRPSPIPRGLSVDEERIELSIEFEDEKSP